ncbi:MAG: integrin alpha [Planctomycetota bacterium]|jgi:hypothetical protein
MRLLCTFAWILFAGFILALPGYSAFHLDIDLDDEGFEILGISEGDETGFSVAFLNVDGDDYTDILISAPYANGTGVVYLIYGHADFGTGDPLELSELGSAGVKILGETQDDLLGWAMASLGDLDGDGKDDFILGAPGHDKAGSVNGEEGRCYLIHGKEKTAFPETLDLSDPGTAELIIDGSAELEAMGQALAFGGEFSGSDDPETFLIGAPLKDTNAMLSGAAYMVYWDNTLTGTTDIDSLITMGKAAEFQGAGFLENAGTSVAGNFDYNGDGLSDIVIGAPGANYGIHNTAGRAYVVLGQSDVLSGTFDLETMHVAMEAVAFDGASDFEQAGYTVLGVQNSHDDSSNFDSVVISAPMASPSEFRSGRVYVIQGNDSISYDVSLDDPGDNGITLNGVEALAGNLGISMAAIGDVNNDGNGDFAFGTSYASPEGQSFAGMSFLAYGSRFFQPEESFDALIPKQPQVMGGKVGDLAGSSLAGGGDMNNDGYPDLLIGARGYTDDVNDKIGRVHFLAGSNTLDGTLGESMSFLPYLDVRGDLTPLSTEGFDALIQLDTAWSSQGSGIFPGFLLFSIEPFADPGAKFVNLALWPDILDPLGFLTPFPVDAATGELLIEGIVMPDGSSGVIIYLQQVWQNPFNSFNWAATNCLVLEIP